MKRNYILFDLDGTLTDSSEGITNAVVYALEYYGIHEDKKHLKKFIGPPLRDSFQEYYGFSTQRAAEAVEKYREYYNAGGMFENQVYPGIPRLLHRLNGAGKTLIVATSKPEGMAREILEHFGLASCFYDIQGADLEGTREKKEDVIRYVLEKQGITDTEDVVMVGDRRHDVEGAAAFGIPCIGVLYGFGSRKELERAKARWIAEDVEMLERLLLG